MAPCEKFDVGRRRYLLDQVEEVLRFLAVPMLGSNADYAGRKTMQDGHGSSHRDDKKLRVIRGNRATERRRITGLMPRQQLGVSESPRPHDRQG